MYVYECLRVCACLCVHSLATFLPALVDLETGEYLLNGHWIVTPFQKLVEFGGTLIEYTGSNSGTERINSTKPLQKRLLVQVSWTK